MCLTLSHTGSGCELTLTAAYPTVKPDPPSNVTAWQVEGQETRVKVTWNLPTSWKHHSHFYKLSFELKYRPLVSSFQSEQVSNRGQEEVGNNWFPSFCAFKLPLFVARYILFLTFCAGKCPSLYFDSECCLCLWMQLLKMKDQFSDTITDVLPGVDYLIQLRARDEYDGVWSDWSAAVCARSWIGEYRRAHAHNKSSKRHFRLFLQRLEAKNSLDFHS